MTVLRADLAQPGTTVDVAVGDGTAPATVAPMPIYDTDKDAAALCTQGRRPLHDGGDE